MTVYRFPTLDLYRFNGLMMTCLQIPDLGCPPWFATPQAYLHPSCPAPQDQVDQAYLRISINFLRIFHPLTFEILEVRRLLAFDLYYQVGLTARPQCYSSSCQGNHPSLHQSSPRSLFNYHPFSCGLS